MSRTVKKMGLRASPQDTIGHVASTEIRGGAAGRFDHAGARDVEVRLRELVAERDALKAELIAARERIAALEKTADTLAERFDWMIDSIQNELGERS